MFMSADNVINDKVTSSNDNIIYINNNINSVPLSVKV